MFVHHSGYDHSGYDAMTSISIELLDSVQVQTNLLIVNLLQFIKFSRKRYTYTYLAKETDYSTEKS